MKQKKKECREVITLVMRLAKNDFKTKYAGSYLGIFWAFVQPVVTVLVYWFVFSKLRSGMVREVPFILWLIAGLVPWFYFQDCMNTGCNALIEYSYLVKKVVFRIEVLPVVKIVSALFVHLFFIAVVLVLYTVMGHVPGITAIQIIYYTFCMFVLTLGVAYLNCSVAVFFRDLTQIVNIMLQVGVWMTPIMWNFSDFNLSAPLQIIFKLNPMYYIVEGYRGALIDRVWFWERPELTAYFWCFTLAVMLVSTRIFSKLRIHFADVL